MYYSRRTDSTTFSTISYVQVETYSLPEQMHGIVFQVQRLARLQRQILREQAYVFELRMWMIPVDRGLDEAGACEVLQTTFKQQIVG